MGIVIPFTAQDGTRDVLDLVNACNRWDRAAEALKARDYDRFDRIMGRRAYAPDGPEAA